MYNTWVAEPVRLVRFWPDHFFASFIIHKMSDFTMESSDTYAIKNLHDFGGLGGRVSQPTKF